MECVSVPSPVGRAGPARPRATLGPRRRERARRPGPKRPALPSGTRPRGPVSLSFSWRYPGPPPDSILYVYVYTFCFRQFHSLSLPGAPLTLCPVPGGAGGLGRGGRSAEQVLLPLVCPIISFCLGSVSLSVSSGGQPQSLCATFPSATRAWRLVGGADTKRRPATPPRIPPCSARSRGFLLRPPRAGRSRAGAAAPARPGGSGDPGRKSSGVRPGRATRRWPARSLRGRFPLTPPAAPKLAGLRASRRPPPRLPVGALAPGRTGAVPAPRSGGGVPLPSLFAGDF